MMGQTAWWHSIGYSSAPQSPSRMHLWKAKIRPKHGGEVGVAMSENSVTHSIAILKIGTNAYMWLASRNTKTGWLLSETKQADGILFLFFTMPTVPLVVLKSNGW